MSLVVKNSLEIGNFVKLLINGYFRLNINMCGTNIEFGTINICCDYYGKIKYITFDYWKIMNSFNNNNGTINVDKEYHISVIGGNKVGKTAMTVLFGDGWFQTEYDPTRENIVSKAVNVDGNKILAIFDINSYGPGMYDLDSYTNGWIRGSHGIIFMYSIASRNSFNELTKLYNKVLELRENNLDKCGIILVGNKSDLNDEREVDIFEGKSLALKWNSLYYETSIRNIINVHECFINLTKMINYKNPVLEPKKGVKNCCTIL